MIDARKGGVGLHDKIAMSWPKTMLTIDVETVYTSTAAYARKRGGRGIAANGDVISSIVILEALHGRATSTQRRRVVACTNVAQINHCAKQ